VRLFVTSAFFFCLNAFSVAAAHATLHCGTAVINSGGFRSEENYCFDDGIVTPPSGGGGTSSGSGDVGGGGSVGVPPTIMMQKHEIRCATAYGQYKPKAGVIVTFSSKWGWGSVKFDVIAETDLPVAPPLYGGYGWVGLYGNTNISEPMATSIYMDSYDSVANTIDTLAHEFAHQNDVLTEEDAEAAGKAAEKAYEADSGAKCSGF
jgi:hypothetical protein